MAAKPPPARIHGLNDDALLLIFSNNGNMFLDQYALHTTRATSLVCQRWRTLMLATPSLWARLLDIDLISFSEHYEWRKELMRRTGTALLWIKVDEVKNKQPADPSRAIGQFFFSLIRENWARIQNLVVYLHATPTFHPTTWEPLSRPAPVLERFNMMWERTQPAQNTDPTPLAVLFSGSAPMLRDFCFLPYTIDERVPWLCQLRAMEFDNAYNIRHILGILQSTPHLQELKIGGIKCLAIRSPLPIASLRLPHLRYLKYEGPPKQGAALLDHIEIPAQCSLHIPSSRDTFPIPANATEQQRLSISNTFVRCIQRYFRFRPPDRISLAYNGDLSITVGAPPNMLVLYMFNRNSAVRCINSFRKWRLRHRRTLAESDQGNPPRALQRHRAVLRVLASNKPNPALIFQMLYLSEDHHNRVSLTGLSDGAPERQPRLGGFR